jgi:hypothetical protein
MRTPSQVVSVILHPLAMPTFGLLCYYSVFPMIAHFSDSDLFIQIFVRILLFTLLLPLISVLFMMRFGKVSTIFIEDKRERSWPLLMASAIYLFTYCFILNSPRVPAFIQLFVLGAACAMLLALLINLRWKISLHMIGIGGLCGGLTVIYYYLQEGNPLWLGVWFMLAGILGTARLIVNAHTPLQVLAGFVLGFAAEFLLAFFVISR